MKDYRSTPLPKLGPGPVTGDVLNHWMDSVMREVLAKADIRNPSNDIATGIVADKSTGLVTLGSYARSSSQRLLNPITIGNRASVQSASAILSATSDATSSTVSIAAHSLKFDFGTVSYGSGSVSGLTPSTAYLIYADDADFEGGAVTYYATTNADNLVATGRYYVGGIATPVSTTAATISAATSASPIAFTTTAAHGWSTGNTVSFASLPGDFGTNLNGNSYTITVTGASTFTVAVNGAGYAAYTTGGTATRVSSASTGTSGGGAGGTDRWDGYDVLTP